MKNVMIILAVCFAGSAFAEKWNRANNPRIFKPILPNKTIEYAFSELPMSATLKDDRLGWSESFWPNRLGGIAYRWSHPDPQPFTYKLKTKEELMSMSQNEISQLSPAELYDISQGDYEYTLTKKVLKKTSPDALWWEGICDGWSLAASRYPEPDKTVITNKDGLKVPFGSSDIKALLAMHDAHNADGFYVRVGNRCRIKGKVPGEELPADGDIGMPGRFWANLGNCSDVNAGAFHVILTNMIGIQNLSFVADVDRFADVWNQPVTSYDSKIVEEVPLSKKDKKKKIYRKVKVQTRMVYGEELSFYDPQDEAEGALNFVSKEPVTGTPAQAFRHKDYEYILELDESGKITGGEWITITRPDMLWGRGKEAAFLNAPYPLSGLNQIYSPVKR